MNDGTPDGFTQPQRADGSATGADGESFHASPGPNAFPPALAFLAPRRTWIGWTWGSGRPSKADRAAGRVPAPTKIPCDLGGRAIDSSKRANLRTYMELREAILAGTISGAAIAMAGNEGDLLALDLDGCRDPATGAFEPWASALLAATRSYAEVSPSGKGLRILGSAEGWSGQSQRRWWTGPDADVDGWRGKGETFFGTGFVTVTFAAIGGTEALWSPVGAVAAALPRRPEDRKGEPEPDALATEEDRRPGRAEAPVAVVAETLAAIENDGADPSSWEWWNRIGMATFRATGGSAEGLAAWESWSARHPAHLTGERDETCADRWNHWADVSPPNRLGYGTLHREAARSMGRKGIPWNGGTAYRAYRAAEDTAGLDALPQATTPAPDDGTHISGNAYLPPVAAVPGGERFPASTETPIPSTETPIPSTGISSLPVISISGFPLHELVDMAESALLASDHVSTTVLRRDSMLVMPTLQDAGSFGDERTLAAQFSPLGQAGMRDVLSRAAIWTRWDEERKGPVRCDPPAAVAAALLDRRGRWRLPRGAGLSTLPVLRPDGSACARPGYDDATGLYLMPDPTLDFGALERAMTGSPGKDEAMEALALLDSLLDEFPFQSPADRSVALSGLLTPVARGAMDVAPLHAIDAPEAGGGKTYLTALCASLTLGRAPYVFTAGQDEAETEKRLGTALMKGAPVIVMDNLNGTLDGSFLCVAVEQRTVSVRVLGQSRDVDVENTYCFFVNGNGITPMRDTVRRTLVCTLDPDLERPESRAFLRDPKSEMLRDRQRYLEAAHTVLRAHARAGFPGTTGLPPLASFGMWSRQVRAALVWLGRADPVETMEGARARDPDRLEFRIGMELLAERQRLWRIGEWTVKQVVALANGEVGPGSMGAVDGVGGERLHEPEKDAANRLALREWLLRVAGNRGAIDGAKLGRWLSSHAKRVSGAIKLVRTDKVSHSDKAVMWRAEPTLKALRIEAGTTAGAGTGIEAPAAT